MTPVLETLNQSYPATAEAVPLARRAICEFAAAHGATPDRVDGIRLAASEALSNIVVHAYGCEEPGRMHIDAGVAEGEVWAFISDDGHGLHAGTESPGLGLGLSLIAQSCDEFSVVNRAEGGTEVRMRFRLPSRVRDGGQLRGSTASATWPASSRFSTTV